ncbi:Uncharacterised protein [Mycobacteroides abscessus subsp. abscessus]|nr:Uncharacterised protein [Mycobacteroides abscessus subsp. abscessus]
MSTRLVRNPAGNGAGQGPCCGQSRPFWWCSSPSSTRCCACYRILLKGRGTARGVRCWARRCFSTLW